jgi:prepilin peptidase CpaA
LLVISRALWILPAVVGAIAGYTDYRWRRIPNWLTVPAFFAGITLNSLARGWYGTRYSLLGAGLGLIILLPFVLMRGIGMGDLKFLLALGALLGPSYLIDVLIVGVFVNALMAIAMIIWKRRVWQTLQNLLRILAALFSLHLPGPDLTLDNPDLVKVPFGVALAIGVLLYAALHAIALTHT